MWMSRELKYRKLNKTENLTIKLLEFCHLQNLDRVRRIILKVNVMEMGCKNVKVTELTQNTVPWGTQIMRKNNFGFYNEKNI